MASHQINLFECDICGKRETTCEDVKLHDMPEVLFDDWGYSVKNPCKLLCPECKKNEDTD